MVDLHPRCPIFLRTDWLNVEQNLYLPEESYGDEGPIVDGVRSVQKDRHTYQFFRAIKGRNVGIPLFSVNL